MIRLNDDGTFDSAHMSDEEFVLPDFRPAHVTHLSLGARELGPIDGAPWALDLSDAHEGALMWLSDEMLRDLREIINVALGES